MKIKHSYSIASGDHGAWIIMVGDTKAEGTWWSGAWSIMSNNTPIPNVEIDIILDCMSFWTKPPECWYESEWDSHTRVFGNSVGLGTSLFHPGNDSYAVRTVFGHARKTESETTEYEENKEVIVDSETLQALFRQSDIEVILKSADHKIELDVNDCDDAVGAQEAGIAAGIYLYELMLSARKIKGNENAHIYRIPFDDYCENDGIAYFVGTEEGLTKMFEANPAKEEADG